MRDAVIEHSRRHYSHPRAEVEREMAQRMGWDQREREQEESVAQMDAEVQALTPHARAVLQRLEATGLTTEQALDLLRAYDLLRIERQLQWLPYRRAKNPAGLLLAAIADNYEAPPAFRPGPNPLTTVSTNHEPPAVAPGSEEPEYADADYGNASHAPLPVYAAAPPSAPDHVSLDVPRLTGGDSLS
jgi:hypothetical protein